MRTKPPFSRKVSVLARPQQPSRNAILKFMTRREYKYIDPKAVSTLLSGYSPVNAPLFASLLEAVMLGLNEGLIYWSSKGSHNSNSLDPSISHRLVGVSDKLLAHNLNRKGLQPWDLFGGLDFDLVHHADHDVGKVVTEVQAYFYHTEHARPEHERRVVLHIRSNKINGTEWSLSLPLQMLMKGWPSIPDGHIGYAHSISLLNQDGAITDQHFYIGVSKRNWLVRMSEHFREIQHGSNKTFHRTWREYIGRRDVMLSSELIVGNHTFNQIMDWEEEQVDIAKARGKSLNMIPGGFKGIKFLHEHRLLGSSGNVTVEDRERAIATYQALNPRTGVPNLLISELWKNEDYAQKVICGAEGRLSVQQIREIRRLNALGIPIEKIVHLVNALNERQVKGVLAGNTYSRIH